MALMTARRIEKIIAMNLFNTPTVLLCSEPTPDKCHRRLVAEYFTEKWGNINIIHL